jgi:hypothetical protein
MLNRLWKTSAPLTVTGLLMLPALLLAILGLVLDPRMITGAPAWLKPAKFSASIAIYVFTLIWVFTLIPEWVRTRRIVGWMTTIVMVLELAIIDLQACRGTTSHFNYRTPLDAFLFAVMGVAITIQTLTSIAVAVALWRQRFQDPALGWAVRFGLTITIIGAFTGALMVRPTPTQLADAHRGHPMPVIGAHTVGAPDGGPGVPGTGWSTEHGDLRVSHFIGLHALQVLLLVALALSRFRLSVDSRVRFTFIAAASYFALWCLLLSQALRGQSVLTPDRLTIVAFGVWTLITAVCGWISIARVRATATAEVI